MAYLIAGGTLLLWWLAANAQGLQDAWRAADLGDAVVAGMLGLLALLPVLLSWRASVGAIGTSLGLRQAAEVYFPGQLAKYLPGSVWSFAAQADLATDHGVPIRVTLSGGFLALGVAVVAAGFVALTCAPALVPELSGWLLALVGLATVATGGVILSWRPTLMARLAAVAGRPALTDLHPDRGRIAVALAWSVLAWICYGCHTLALVMAFGAAPHAAVATSIGGFALAWTVGFLAVFAPAGAGVREAVLVVALSGVLGVDAATLVALLSRGLLTVVDIVVAVSGLLLRRARSTTGRPSGRDAS